jgi:hypothetical protein
MLVALAASFRFDGDGNDLLERFAPVSKLRGIQVQVGRARTVPNSKSRTGAAIG